MASWCRRGWQHMPATQHMGAATHERRMQTQSSQLWQVKAHEHLMRCSLSLSILLRKAFAPPSALKSNLRPRSLPSLPSLPPGAASIWASTLAAASSSSSCASEAVLRIWTRAAYHSLVLIRQCGLAASRAALRPINARRRSRLFSRQPCRQRSTPTVESLATAGPGQVGSRMNLTMQVTPRAPYARVSLSVAPPSINRLGQLPDTIAGVPPGLAQNASSAVHTRETPN